MKPAERRIAIGAAVTLVALVVAIGVVLAAGDGDDAAKPFPVAADTASSPSGVVTESAAGGGKPLRLSGVDPTTGEQVRLADFAGEPVVLNFWASWCTPCREELPALIDFAKRHPEAAVVGVNVEDGASDARALQEEIGFTWPSIADPDSKIASSLGLIGMPATFFLDRRHIVRGSVIGQTDLAGFEQGLALATGST